MRELKEEGSGDRKNMGMPVSVRRREEAVTTVSGKEETKGEMEEEWEEMNGEMEEEKETEGREM